MLDSATLVKLKSFPKLQIRTPTPLLLTHHFRLTIFSFFSFKLPVYVQENCVQLDIKGRPLKIIDFPGAERLRKQLVEKWLKKERDSLKKIVFVLDSASFTKRARDVAEFFYDVALESTKKV